MMMISKMTMQQVLKTYGEQGKGKPVAAAKTASPASQPDQLILSAEAQDFGQLMQQVKAAPGVRQAHLPADAQEQGLADLPLQQPHLMADCRLRQADLLRRPTEALEPRGRLEALQELGRRDMAKLDHT